MNMLYGYTKRRILGLFQCSYVDYGKLTKYKRCVYNFRHINTRIAETSLAFPLVRGMFSMLEGSKCEVLSVIHLQDAFHLLRLTEESKKYLGMLPYLVVFLTCTRENQRAYLHTYIHVYICLQQCSNCTLIPFQIVYRTRNIVRPL